MKCNCALPFLGKKAIDSGCEIKFGEETTGFKITGIFYTHGKFFYKLIKKNDNYFYSCCRLLRGERIYGDVFKRLRSLNIVK